jgi:hypothetical protein
LDFSTKSELIFPKNDQVFDKDLYELLTHDRDNRYTDCRLMADHRNLRSTYSRGRQNGVHEHGNSDTHVNKPQQPAAALTMDLPLTQHTSTPLIMSTPTNPNHLTTGTNKIMITGNALLASTSPILSQDPLLQVHPSQQAP